MSNVVTVGLRLNGNIATQLAPQLASMRGQFFNAFSDVRRQADITSRYMRRSFNNLDPSIGTSVDKLKGGLGKAAGAFKVGMLAAVAAAGAGVLAVSNSLRDASETEMSRNNAASSLQIARGGSLQSNLATINKQVTLLAKAAAALPGTTADYTKALTNIQPVIEGIMRTSSNEEKDKLGVEFAISAGLRNAGTPNAIGIDRIPAMYARGAKQNEFMRLDGFERNQGLVVFTKYTEKLKSLFGKTIETATAEQRLRAGNAAEKEVLQNPQLLLAQASSLSGMIEGFKSVIFDPDTGIFGLFREFSLTSNVKTSGLTEFKIFFNSLFGLLTTLGGLLFPKSNGDILTTFFTSLNGLTSWINGFNRKIKSVMFAGEFGEVDLAKVFSYFSSSAAQFVGKMLAGLINFITYVAANLETIIPAVLIFTRDVLNVTLKNIDWGQLGKGLFSAFMALMVVAAGFMAVGLLGVFGTPFLILASLIVVFWEDIVDLFKGGYENVKNFFQSIGNFLGGIVNFITSTFMSAADGLRNSLNSVGDFILGIFQGIKDALPSFLTTPKDEEVKRVANRAGGQDPLGIMAAINRERSSAGNFNPVIANSSEMILNRSQQSSLLNGIGGKSITQNNYFNITGGDVVAIRKEIESVLSNSISQLGTAFQS